MPRQPSPQAKRLAAGRKEKRWPPGEATAEFPFKGKRTENMGSFWAREDLIILLRRDEQVDACFRQIADSTGVRNAFRAVMKPQKRLLDLLGRDRFGELFDEPKLRKKEKANIRRLFADLDKELIVLERIRASSQTRRKMRSLVDQFIRRHFNRGWQWLIDELENYFWTNVDARVEACGIVLERNFHPAVPLAPRMSYSFETHPAETARTAIERFRGETAIALDRLERRVWKPERGRIPDGERVTRNVTWLYRAKVRGESIAGIAREYSRVVHGDAEHHRDDRPTVYAGIRQALRWLDCSD